MYRLPTGTTLSLSGRFYDAYSLDADASSIAVQVPPGDYQVSLFDSAGDTTVWPLLRQNADGTTETVPGTLHLTPMISVAAGQATNLVIRFQVQTGGMITFSKGEVDVSVQVDEAVESFDIAFAASSLTVDHIEVAAAAPSALPPRLPTLGDHGDGYTATMHATARWYMTAPDTVCAPVAAAVLGSGSQGFADLVAEAPPSDGWPLCIEQIGERAVIFVAFGHQGPATTPLLSDLGDHPFLVYHGVQADVDAVIFDGTTLRLGALAGTHSAQMSVFGKIFGQADTSTDFWFDMDEQGDGTLSVTPR